MKRDRKGDRRRSTDRTTKRRMEIDSENGEGADQTKCEERIKKTEHSKRRIRERRRKREKER